MPEDTNDSGTEMPDLSELDGKGLDALAGKLHKRFEALNAKDRVTAEDLAEMTTIADQSDAIKARKGELVAEAAEEAKSRAELAARMTAEEEPEAPEDAPADPEAPEAPEAPVEDEEEEAEASAPNVLEAIAASTGAGKVPAQPKRGPVAREVDAKRTQMPERFGDGVTIVASSDIPGTTQGTKLDRDGLSKALHARARGMADGNGRGNSALVASISKDEIKWDADKATTDEAVRDLWERSHDTESLVASGGWCAPSETIYDFVCDFEAVDGLLDLPSITSNRGGLRFPISPLLKDVFEDADAGFTWTEADDIAAATPGGPTKPCFTIPCPDFDEVRLQAQGICVTAGNLTDRAYPELTNRYVDLVMAAHAHRMNGLTIAKVVAASTAAPTTLDADLGAANALLGGIEFQIARLRDIYFMAEDQRLEIVLPRWVRAVVRHDIARRNGVPMSLVTNGEIAAWFSDIGASAQFVTDWQMLAEGATAWPTSVDILVYPAGTHTRLDGGSIDLGVVRDSTLNSTNDYTAAWTEEFWQVVTRGCVSLVVTIPICASGNTGLQTAFTCPTA